MYSIFPGWQAESENFPLHSSPSGACHLSWNIVIHAGLPQRAFLDSVLSWTISSSDPKESLEISLLLIPPPPTRAVLYRNTVLARVAGEHPTQVLFQVVHPAYGRHPPAAPYPLFTKDLLSSLRGQAIMGGTGWVKYRHFPTGHSKQQEK